MKNFLCPIFVSLSFFIYAQKNTILKSQKIALNEAERYLKTNQLDMAADIFKYTYKLDDGSKLGVIAVRKYDSIMKSILIKDIIGKWILFEQGSNWGFTEEKDSINRKVLVISKDEFQFYDENIQTKEQKNYKTEKIILTKFEDTSGSRFDFVFSDKSLWRIFWDNRRKYLRQFSTGEETIDNRTEIFCGNIELNYKRYDEGAIK
ncbi:hypothetical protein [Flavobacterium ustbae]|uniref:hypothetical protein n=1 Tax=Flavobacterium ustbae TaxID=2488790 RepID=UPI000F79653D|nr:hypothetical protein [Flavobacterium ustbae]